MYSVFEQLCQSRNVTPYRVSKDTGVSQTTLSRWKITGKDPDRRVLIKLSEYFDVNIDFLIYGETDTGYYLNPETAKLAQEMYEDPDMRALFHMKRHMEPERFRVHMESMKAMYRLEHPDDDTGC